MSSCNSGCTSGCTQYCGICSGCKGCTGSCKGGCTGCNSSCSSCSGSCSSTCTSTCTGTCTNQCTQTCLGTCTGDCNNACTSTQASTSIANLGSSIDKGKIIKLNDIKSLQDAIIKEYKRRSITNTDNTFDINKIDYHKKFFNDIKTLVSSTAINVNSKDIIIAENYKQAKIAIQNLMTQNIKK